MTDDQRTRRCANRERNCTRVWHHPESDIGLQQRIVRTLVREIVVRGGGAVVRAVAHWEGGDHSRLAIPGNRTGDQRWKADEETERVVRDVARI